MPCKIAGAAKRVLVLRVVLIACSSKGRACPIIKDSHILVFAIGGSFQLHLRFPTKIHYDHFPHIAELECSEPTPPETFRVHETEMKKVRRGVNLVHRIVMLSHPRVGLSSIKRASFQENGLNDVSHL
jgi:hypothetical protein